MLINRAVIFDMDGVIVNSEPVHEAVFYEVVEAIGHGETHGIDFSEYVGRSEQDLWKDFIAKNKPRESMEQLLAMKRERAIHSLLTHKPIFPGLLELLEGLAGRYKLAVASGSERAVVEAVLTLENMNRYFPVVVTAAEVERGKPAPDIFLRVARLLEVEPKDCWVIEDSKPGVIAGLAAGMRVIALTNTHPANELQKAHHVVQDYAQLAALLRDGSGQQNH